MDYVKHFDINGVATRQVACIELHGKPNAATVGSVGVLGVDVDSPTHEVYKCVAVRGSVYTWELLSSGMSIMCATISGEGAETARFPYEKLRTPATYVVKVGDVILDREGYLYHIESLNSTYCEARYSGTQLTLYGKSAYAYAQDGGYTGTEAEFAEDLAGVGELSEEVAELLEQTALMQYFVDSVDEMTDTSKRYVLKSTGTVWEYKATTSIQTVREDITEGFTDDARLGSDGSTATDPSGAYNGFVCTPTIDLSKYPVPFTLHLKGIPFYPTTAHTYTYCYCWDKSGNGLGRKTFRQDNSAFYWNNSFSTETTEAVVGTDGTLALTFAQTPKHTSGVDVGSVRFSAKGTSTDAEVYITYEVEVQDGGAWVDTEIPFGYFLGGVDKETLDKISELNNEGDSPSTIKLLPKPVLDFYNASAYSDSDYTTSHLEKITYPCRADIPVPFTVKWEYNENAMRTTVAVDRKTIGTANAYTLLTYDATGLNKYPLYNLLPNTRYYYKVTHIMADGSLVEAKSGSFTTSTETIRFMYIDGTQNVRDLGGWIGLNGKKVKYGKIFRGASFSDTSYPELVLTGKGKRSLGELKVQAELNLGAADTETSISATCAYHKIGYSNYASAITDATARANFKTVLEKIVSWLIEATPRNIYMHCQGGCDRTGTLSFQLLGLLGVSESDLAKEYELSSFSDIGFGRLRTTTKAVDVYDYVGMVEALKEYSGNTITDKFYNFAISGCGISADTITSFRNLMLE